MGRANQNQYAPDYVSPPGETLSETLEIRGMSQAELAERTGRAKKTINEIVKGKARITPRIALELEHVLSVAASFWNARESQYQDYLARKEEQGRFEKHLKWLDLIPVRVMVKLGWIEGFKDRIQQLREVLKFFQISSPDQWDTCVRAYADQVAFRKSKAFEGDLPAVIAWLRRGEIEARELKCALYDQSKFKEALQTIRGLTAESPAVFHAKMVELASAAGVAVVLIPELPRIRISAATRWLSPHKAMIQLSLLYKRNDQFWFSFFHEAGHILLHGKRDIFINDQENNQNVKEGEANSFAANFLIPPSSFRALIKGGAPSKEKVLRFASELGIAPGIIVGRLQREHILPWHFYNDLKVSFDWLND
ncbi:MAG: ImmA/IrrE family metallo-endopeptidase [Syntrophobacteraceae bacterium]|jgi:plasmid maintenance system antidote protein VapI